MCNSPSSDKENDQILIRTGETGGSSPLSSSSSSSSDRYFDSVVGALEDILVDPAFAAFQHDFFEMDYSVFTAERPAGVGRPLECTEIFLRYTDLVEGYLEGRLKETIEDFSMENFVRIMHSQPERLTGDVFDVLASLVDFEEFADLVVDYGKDTERRLSGQDIGEMLMVRNLSIDI